MKLTKAVYTTLADWLRRDPAMGRLEWLIGTCAMVPFLPVVAALRWNYVEPERNPDYRRPKR